MITIKLKSRIGAALYSAQFDILPPSDLPLSIIQEQFLLVRQTASTDLLYYFLVTTDCVRGWNIADGSLVFEQPTVRLFAAYAQNDAAKISGAEPHYLAAPTQAWLADLTSHWRSGHAKVPGESDMQKGGVLGFVRSAATIMTEIV